MLEMIADGGDPTASGSTYTLEVGDDSIFQVVAQRGTSITVDSGADTELSISAGLYQITFNGWIQLNGNVSGQLDYQFRAKTSGFPAYNVAFDRNITQFGSTATVQPIVDPSHTVLFNAVADTSIFFDISVVTGNSQTYKLRGDAVSCITNLQILRIGDAV